MKLSVTHREGKKKSEAKQIRRAGDIPAILYSTGKSNELLVINGVEFATALRAIQSGRLSTTVFALTYGKEHKKVVVKDIQYHPATYRILHIDVEELVEGSSIVVKVPIVCTGVSDCSGIKLGGFLRQVVRTVKVECSSEKHIPTEFAVDVRELGIRQSKRLSDLTIPAGLKLLADLDEVVVSISKR
jgi:large subunit ribosomal protein L25